MKTIWIYFLIFVSTIISCDKGDIDYVVKADYIYVNNSQKTVIINDVVDNGKLINNVKLEPKETRKFILRGGGGDISKRDVNNCCQDLLENIHGGGILLKIDTLCISYSNSGMHDIKNYNGKRLSDRYLEYTYYFTDENLKEAKSCEEEK